MESGSHFSVPETLAVSDSGFLFNAATGETFTLNPIGKEVFLMLKEGMPLSAIKEKILADYNTNSTTVDRDIEDYLALLKHYNLVTAR